MPWDNSQGVTDFLNTIAAKKAAKHQKQREAVSDAQVKAVEDDARRKQGLDPATGLPIKYGGPSQVRPNNHGKGGAPTADELAAHYAQIAAWYSGQGALEPARQFDTLARQYATQSYQDKHLDELRYGIDTRAQTALTTTGERVKATERGQDLNQQNVVKRVQATERGQDLNQQNVGARIKAIERGQDLTHEDRVAGLGQHGVQAVQHFVGATLQQFSSRNAAARTAGKPEPYPNMAQYGQALTQSVSELSKNPKLLQQKIARMMKAPLSEEQKATAIQAMTQAAQAASAPGGGSQDNARPPAPLWP